MAARNQSLAPKERCSATAPPKLPSPALLAFDEVKFLAEVTPQDEEILYRIDVRKHNREQKLLLAEGRVVAGGTERATVGSLLLVVLRHREPRH